MTSLSQCIHGLCHAGMSKSGEARLQRASGVCLNFRFNAPVRMGSHVDVLRLEGDASVVPCVTTGVTLNLCNLQRTALMRERCRCHSSQEYLEGSTLFYSSQRSIADSLLGRLRLWLWMGMRKGILPVFVVVEYGASASMLLPFPSSYLLQVPAL